MTNEHHFSATGDAAPPRSRGQLQEQRVDRLGAFASSLCAVHCVVAAVGPGLLAAGGLAALLSPRAEWSFTLAAVAFAVPALWFGWRRHGSATVAGLFAIGIVGILGARLLEEAVSPLYGSLSSAAAGVALVTAHLLNLRLGRRARIGGESS